MRIVSDIYALELTTLTYGLGVGLGSARPSSLLTYLLSNIGVFGFVLFFLILFVLHKAVSDLRHRLGPYDKQLPAISAAWWGLIALVATKIMSGPVVSTPVLWMWWLVVLGAVSAVQFPEHSDRTGVSGEPREVRGRHAGEIT